MAIPMGGSTKQFHLSDWEHEHLVSALSTEDSDNILEYADGSVWEAMAHDMEAALKSVYGASEYLSESLDSVLEYKSEPSVQLGRSLAKSLEYSIAAEDESVDFLSKLNAGEPLLSYEANQASELLQRYSQAFTRFGDRLAKDMERRSNVILKDGAFFMSGGGYRYTPAQPMDMLDADDAMTVARTSDEDEIAGLVSGIEHDLRGTYDREADY